MGELPQIQLASLCDGENPWQGKEGREVCVQDKGGTRALGEGEIRRRMSLDPHPQESQTCSRCVCRSGAVGMLLWCPGPTLADRKQVERRGQEFE